MDYYFSDYIPRLMIVLSVAACGIYVAMSGLGVIGKIIIHKIGEGADNIK